MASRAERRRIVSMPESVQFLLGRPECISSFTERFTSLYVHNVLHLAEVAGRRAAARAAARAPAAPPPQHDDGCESADDSGGESSEGTEQGADDLYALAPAPALPAGDECEGDPSRTRTLINDRRLYELRSGARASDPLGPWRCEPPATLAHFSLYMWKAYRLLTEVRGCTLGKCGARGTEKPLI